MAKINYRLVFNRSRQLNEQGKALVQVEAYLKGKRAYFSTQIYLTERQWSQKKGRVVRHPDADSLNYMLREFVMQLEHKELELWKRGEKVTLEALKGEPKQGKADSFLEFVGREIESACSRESTRKNLQTTWKLLSVFCPDLRFEELNYQKVQEFERFLNNRGLSTNTTAKHLKHLRTFVNNAIVKGYMKEGNYPFRRYRIKTVESKHTFLTAEELGMLENLFLPERYRWLQHTLDAFLFCCYTGLRYSDFVRLTKKAIVGKDGEKWLVFSSQKTGTGIQVPVYLLFEGKACRMLEKYKENQDAFFALEPNARVNRMLQLIRTLAGIGKHITFHTARHTNATLLIYEGANITTVQKLLGHRSVVTTQGYSEIMGKTVVKDLENVMARKL